LTDEKVRKAKKPKPSSGTEADAKTDAVVERLLRAVWEHREIAATSPDLYRRRLHHSVPELPCNSAHSGWNVGKRLKTDEGLRNLWEAFYAAPFDQPDLRGALLQRIRKIERAKALEWLDRIRATGNGLIPQIPELLGRAIAENLEAAE
jgi:hypothetical protein